MERRHLKWIGLVALLVMAAAACGQKPGVSEQAAPAGALGGLPAGAAGITEEGEIVNERGEVIGSAEEFGVGGGGDTTTTTGEGGGGDTTGPAGATGPSGRATGAGPPTGGNATGVSDTTIKIGSHAPLTGAAPVPSDATDKGSDLYFRWLERKGRDVNGRNAEVLLKNDQYNPSSAVAICKEMVEKDGVFLLTGLAGTDQIQSCARYAASVNVPYLSAGVTETGLTALPNYFATSMTYPDQGPLLADLLTSRLGAKGEKNGIVIFQSANFEDGRQAFLEAMRRQGAKVSYDRAVSKRAGVNEARTVVQEMNAAGIENAYFLVAPVWFLQVLKEAGNQGYDPQWVGVGLTMTFDTIANIGCRNSNNGFDGAKFFSPFPAYSEFKRFDPSFAEGLAMVNEDQSDGDRDNDFIWGLWAAGKGLAQALDLPGRNLTRERFVWFYERARNLKNGINPPVSYTPDNHFGADTVHLSEVSCSDGRWHTIQSFAKDF